VIARSTHVQEERLLDCYLAERAAEPLDPRVAEHLADCQACAVRYADLTQFMDALRNEADAETDALFTPDSLVAQQRHIAQRIEHVGHTARVITFPERSASHHSEPAARRLTARWAAGMVAAGLMLGVGLGASFRWDRRAPLPGSARTASAPARLSPVATDGIGHAVTADDDAFLSDLEIALESPRTRELQAYDTLTPHVQEINVSTLRG
jgi:anti-sigma factor RsiW